MQPGYPLRMDFAAWAVVAFVLAIMFLSGLLAGYLFGLTQLVRNGHAGRPSKSIWTVEDES